MTGIFFNNDTLILALPLIVLCTSYAFFKLVPLHIGVPIIGVAFLFYRMNAKLSQRRVEQSLNKVMDDSFVQELEGDEKEKTQKKSVAKKAKKEKKTTDTIRQRLNAEKKAEQANSSGDKKSAVADDDDDDWDEDAAMMTFAKGNKDAGKKKR